ncbi:MAG: phosphate ABC transporter substrate-binding protein [Chloroflexi bacterium RBG_16_56_11]|nr:MAG: phosphate ABC transporter substrate-binding protein [Chloroflexi bacterium RBG_16_56_11]
MKKSWLTAIIFTVALAIFAAGCGSQTTTTTSGATNPTSTTTPTPTLTGTIEIDGSSTVYPITEAVAEEFRKVHPRMRINVGISGTGGGFKRFVVGEIQISDASRPIKDSEKEQAQKNNIEWIELPVAYDGLSVMVNPRNTWATSMTVAELKKLWEPGSTITRWNHIRVDWPDQPIHLYGPGTDSGTFDYFTEAIVGKEDSSRADYTASEDDNVLVQGIAGDPNGLGYFGFAYYVENQDKLKLVAVDAGSGPVVPSVEVIRNGTYKPLSRPIFIYVNKAALTRPEVKEFIRFYMTAGPDLVSEVGYVPLPSTTYTENLTKIQ